MKNKYFILSAVCSASLLGACVNVDDETAQTPSVYWEAPADAQPREFVEPKDIHDHSIDVEGEKAGTAKAGGTAGEKADVEVKAESKSAASNSGAAGSGVAKAGSAAINGGKFVRASDKIDAGNPLQITDLIDIALENNPATRVSWFNAKAAAAAVGKADSAYYPQLSVSGNVYRARTKPSLGYGGAAARMGRYYETGYGPSAEINWLLCDFGKRSASVESARAALFASNFEYNRAVQEVILNVNLAYYSLFEALGNVAAAKLNIEDAQTAYLSARERFNSGVGNKPDMLNALANLKNAEYALQNSEASVETARAGLAQALGVRVTSKLKIGDDFVVPASSQTDAKIDDLLAEAMRSRQDLLAAYANLKKTEMDIDVAKRNFLPQISATASATYLDYSEHGRNAQDDLRVGVGISWSLFEGFARKYDLISAKMQRRAQAQILKQVQIKIMSDIWSAYYLYKSAFKQLASAEAAVEANLEAYNATKAGYESGVNSITDFLNSQNRLASARQQVVLAKSTLASSIAKLAYAVGSLR